MKKRVIVLLLLLQSSLFALSATGYGKTAKEAKDAALSELSNIVVSNVKSTLSSSTSVSGQKVTKDAKTSLEVSSATYFQGVHYSDAVKGGDGYEVTATLDATGIANTLGYITKELNKDLAKLSKDDLKRLLKMSEMGYALANFTAGKDTYHELMKEREDEVLKYLSYGQLFFYVKPKNAKIVMDNENYESFKSYVLPAKSYHYEVSLEGYHSETGKIYLNSASKREVSVSLVKQSSVKPVIYLDIDKELANSAKEVFSKYHIETSDDPMAANAIKFRFQSSFVTQIDEIKVYNLIVTAEAFKGAKSVMLKKAKIKNVTDSTMVSKKAKGVEALSNYLLKKLNMKEFKGERTVDYSKL